MPLQPQSLEDVKVIVRKHTPDGIEADSVTRNGEWASFQLARKKYGHCNQNLVLSSELRVLQHAKF